MDAKFDATGGFRHWLRESDADICCIQEHKVTNAEQLDDFFVRIDGYESFWSFCKTKKVVSCFSLL